MMNDAQRYRHWLHFCTVVLLEKHKVQEAYIVDSPAQCMTTVQHVVV